MTQETVTLLIHCPDQLGLVHDVTGFILTVGGNIADLQQHIASENGSFFMRVVWQQDLHIYDEAKLRESFARLATRRQMRWQLHLSNKRHRLALFVTKESHCLYDLLSRHESGEMDVDLPLIISNHNTLRSAAERFNIPFYHLPVTPENKVEVENAQLRLLETHQIDTIVLARYMQIVQPKMIQAYPNRIINIHHSFLPAFVGAKPYHQAYERGVKIIGATSHYVTEQLDQGPIIHQDVTAVSHEDGIHDLVRRGRDLEKNVLSRAIWKHISSKVLVCGNKTIVFS